MGMGRPQSESDVAHLVPLWLTRKARIKPTGEAPLVIPSVYFVLGHTIEDVRPIIFEMIISVRPRAQHSRIPICRPMCHLHVVMGPRSAPTRPAPKKSIARKEIARFTIDRLVLEARSRNAHHSLVVPVSFKQFGAKSKESRCW